MVNLCWEEIREGTRLTDYQKRYIAALQAMDPEDALLVLSCSLLVGELPKLNTGETPVNPQQKGDPDDS